MTGRWPANTILTHLPWCPPDGCAPGCVVAQLDEQSGERPSSGGAAFETGGYGGTVGLNRNDRREIGFGDSGGASRFFLTFRYTPEDFDLLEPDGAA